MHLLHKSSYLKYYFQTLSFLRQFRQKRNIYLKRNPYTVINQNSLEIGSNSVMRGSKQVLVKIELLQSKGRSHPQDDNMPNFFPDCKSSVGFQIRYHLFLNQFKKGIKIAKFFLKTCCMISMHTTVPDLSGKGLISPCLYVNVILKPMWNRVKIFVIQGHGNTYSHQKKITHLPLYDIEQDFFEPRLHTLKVIECCYFNIRLGAFK